MACEEQTAGPLAGVRVLDLSSVIMGPYATQILGDLGAEVITVEAPDAVGNRTMGAGPHADFSGISLNLLRNKRSLCIDLKNPAGADFVRRLAATSAVLVTNLRPMSLGRLRLGYADVAAVRPDIVYCQAQGFPTDGDRADDPAYDDIIQAECGIADAFRRTGQDPALAPTILADKICGQAIASAVLAGLLHRARTGRGQRIEIAMIEIMRSFMLVEHGAAAISSPPMGPPGWHRVLSPSRGPQRTSDGWINILPYSVAAYKAIFEVGGRLEMLDDPRLAPRTLSVHAPFLYDQIRPIIATQDTAYWLDFCADHQIPVGRIKTLDELVEELPLAEHPVAGAYRQTGFSALFDDSPATVRSPAPLLGQDGMEIGREIGLSEDALGAMIADGTLRGARTEATNAHEAERSSRISL
jgi:crotonobetainyl-CoA:carnitine CoA-transferase CaiB-like acyl-CoA transferase